MILEGMKMMLWIGWMTSISHTISNDPSAELEGRRGQTFR